MARGIARAGGRLELDDPAGDPLRTAIVDEQTSE
jgi:hypothetical protein